MYNKNSRYDEDGYDADDYDVDGYDVEGLNCLGFEKGYSLVEEALKDEENRRNGLDDQEEYFYSDEFPIFPQDDESLFYEEPHDNPLPLQNRPLQ